ncbi:DNA starvation/stationary phase protection protein [Defluviimonas sp. WL0002]|uniref:DNA starvation/stationary phase protection protein n=1 Tax=Albidovulum marisflavi TaxID=2984159 RepID=A0ABT2ZDL3_9RHOB|nr:DNA starvation/stationary phase protection protein [Defluviimonas sp. WL0002]MCV2869107.1 DNA starvation/stationary phase protection protein [Defluviimonas sp. WL0002]
MTDAMDVVPGPEKVETGVRNAKAISQALNGALADTYRLVFKTHAYHWNVEGPLFYGIHNLTEDQYKNLFDAADEIAERARALGQLAPARMKDILDFSVVKDCDELPSAEVMVEELARDHEQVARRMHDAIALSDEHNDPVTADLLTQRSAFHETAAWMLRAIAK